MKLSARDIFTPANAISTLGLVLVLFGCLQLHEWQGFILVALGRMLDLVDGPVARATRTTRFSIYFDPTCDKIAMLAILVSAFYFKLVPVVVIAYILLQNTIVAVLSVIAQRRHVAVGALIPGKLNLFFQMIAIAGFIASHLVQGNLSSLLAVVAYSSLIISIPFAILATKAYARLLRPTPDEA